jgi:hypothetical protein
MKIRQDFVTNSSSASFIVAVKTKCNIPEDFSTIAEYTYKELKNMKSNGEPYGNGFDKVVEFSGWTYDWEDELEELEQHGVIRVIEVIDGY